MCLICKNRKKVEEVLTTLGPNAGQMVGEWLQSPQRPGTTGKSKNSSPALEDVRSVCSAPDKATQKVMSNLQGLMNGLPERAEHRVELASHITGGMNSRDIKSKLSISKKTIENARKLSRAAGDQKGPSSSDTKSSFPTINEKKAENSQAVITPVASSRRKKGCKRKRQNDSTTAAMVDHLRSKMYTVTTSGSAADSYILPIKKFEAYLDFRSQYTKILKSLDEDTVTTVRTRRHLRKIKQLPTIKVATWSDHRRKRRKNRLRKSKTGRRHHGAANTHCIDGTDEIMVIEEVAGHEEPTDRRPVGLTATQKQTASEII